MNARTTRWKTNELIPLADRIRYMQLFRLVASGTVVVAAVVAHRSLGVTPGRMFLGVAGYLVVSFASELVWRVSGRRALGLFGAMLVTDALFLAWVAYQTGGTASPLRYLIVLHLVSVTLLASYRTSLRLAMWHSMLLTALYYAEKQGGVTSPLLGGKGSFWELQYFSFLCLFWLVALGTATFSAVNERELRRRRFDLEALAAMAGRLEEASSPASVGAVLVDSITDTFAFSRAALVAFPAGGADPVPLLMARASAAGGPAVHDGTRSDRPVDGEAASDTVADRALESTAPPSLPQGVLARAAAGRETVLVGGLDPEDSWLGSLLPGATNLVLVPLWAGGRCAGVCVAEHSLRGGSRIERRVVSTLEGFVSHAALALRNALLLEEVQHSAATDALTGIANRRTFEESLSREVARAMRLGEELSLIMVDIDHFKPLNDRFGHQAGDEVIRQVARTLTRRIRRFDTAARYGGEEFAVILPCCGTAEALRIAEQIRRSVSDLELIDRVTVSTGIATLPTHGVDAAGLLGAADGALYQSKRAGRDQSTAVGALPG